MNKHVVVALLSLLSACATAPGTPIKDQVVHTQLHRVLTTCERMHEDYLQSGKIDCRVWGLSRMHLSIKSISTYEDHNLAILTMVRSWCGAARMTTPDTNIFYSWDYREEQSTFSRICENGQESK